VQSNEHRLSKGKLQLNTPLYYKYITSMQRRIVSRCTAGSFLVATKRLTHVVQKTIPKLSFLVVILL
jgi:hypothetical protein